MDTKENKREINMMIESEVPAGSGLSADITMYGKLVAKPGYEKALDVISRITEYIDYSKHEHGMAHIEASEIDGLALKNMDADTEAKVRKILKMATEKFGGVIVCSGDIDYSHALVNAYKGDKCNEDIERCTVKDHTHGFGFMLMAVALAVTSGEGTDIEMTWYGPGEEETYYITGDGKLYKSADSEYYFDLL